MTKIFVGGSRGQTKLDDKVKKRLDNIIRKEYGILLGDANGIDKAVQKYLSEKDYGNVVVYCTGQICRNNLGDWEIRHVEEPHSKRDFRYYAAKDREMVNDADYGFMIWDGESKGTLNNIGNLLKAKKPVLMYLHSSNDFYTLRSFEDFKKLLAKCDKKISKTLEHLMRNIDTAKNMKKLKAKHVSVAEGGEEYFSVMFEEKRDSLENYFLIQRVFECEEDELDPPYLDCDDMTFCGHLKINRVELSRNRFYIQLADKQKSELEVSFDISDKQYHEVKEYLGIILSGLDFVKIE